MWETGVGAVKAVMKSSLITPEKNPKASGNLQMGEHRYHTDKNWKALSLAVIVNWQQGVNDGHFP
jgi:hypothetical protein